MTRVENLSDIVFAIALGMLVSASTAPSDYDGLIGHLISIVPISAGFAVMLTIWSTHFVFFRRYGIADARIIFYNSILLLAVLFLAYPLRFTFESLFAFIIGTSTADWDRMAALGLDYRRAANVLAYFFAGFACVNALLAAMYAHALGRAAALELSDAELVLTRRSFFDQLIITVLCLVGGAVALLTQVGPFAGALLGLIWPFSAIVNWLTPLPKTNEPATP